jgi:hypothetical protein
LVFLQHPAQQVQLLADAMDPHLGALRVAVKVRTVLGQAQQGPGPVGQELHRGEGDREALAGGGTQQLDNKPKLEVRLKDSLL